MVAVASSGALYFLIITILSSKNGDNLKQILGKIAGKLDDNSANINVLHKFKLAGEFKVVAVIKVFNNTGLDRMVDQLWDLGELQIDSQPIITYESFARNLGVSDELTQPSTVVLKKEDNLYWLTLHVEYFGNKTSEVLPVWKVAAEEYLAGMKSGAIRAIFYKNLAERLVQMFWHVPDREQLDQAAFNCPLIISFGSNIRTESKGLHFLDQYRVKN